MAKTVVPSSAGARRGAAGSDEVSEAMPASYEAALAELEALVGQMESGDLSLEASLAAYRRGAALVAFCQQQLEKVEQQVRVLDGDALKPMPDAPSGAQAARALDTDLETGAA
jgi:exodeoxyribonuclease VII small subunit